MRVFNKKSLNEIIKVLPDADRIKIFIVIGVQIFLSLLDLAGIGIIGILGALAVTGVESRKPGSKIDSILKLLHMNGLSFQGQVALLGAMAAGLLIFRTVASITLTKKTLLFISRRGALISSQLITSLFSRSLADVEHYTEQEVLFSTTTGVQNLTLGVIGTGIIVISDLSLLVVLACGLFAVDPVMAISVFVIFSILGYILYKYMRHKAYKIGLQEVQYGIQSNQKIVEFLNTYREATVKNRRQAYVSEISQLRYNLADVLAEKTFMPNVSKYVVETTVVLGALIIGGIQFTLQDATHAVASLSVFLAAGTRIAPAVLRIQQGAIQMRSNIGSSATTLEMIKKYVNRDDRFDAPVNPNFNYSGFVPNVSIDDVTYQYSDAEKPAVKNITLKINSGEVVALVGPSGAGKSTLVDLLLGIYEPGNGSVEISGLAPLETFSKWPGATAYVPQSISITLGTIRQNIALGLDAENFPEHYFWEALERAQLADFVRSLPNGLDNFVGDQGTKLSGGQRQRLGIARALFTKPKLLVLDEATSALDVETEASIAAVIQSLGGSTTVITIAHRLSSVRSSDRIVYIDDGSAVASGTFEELRSKVPNFDKQAGIMGL